MRLLLPDTEPKKVQRVRSRQRRRKRLYVGLGVLALLVLVYMFPRPRLPDSLFEDVDGRVLQSLREFPVDFPYTRVDVGGTIWSFRKVGSGPEAVVFLHGMSGSSDIWWQQMTAMGDQYTLVSLTYAPVATLEQAAAGIRGMLDSERIDAAHFVGSALGGSVAQFFAGRFPDRVKSLVLTNSFPPGTGGRRGGPIAPLAPTWYLQGSLQRSIRQYVYPASGNSALVRDFLLAESRAMSRQEYLTRLRLLRASFSPPDLAEAGIPALIIEADNDPLVSAERREALRDTYPTAEVRTISDVGHFPFLNRPAQFTRELERFFASQRPLLPIISPEGAPLVPDSASIADSAGIDGPGVDGSDG